MSTFYADYTKCTIKVINDIINENYRGGVRKPAFRRHNLRAHIVLGRGFALSSFSRASPKARSAGTK